MTAVGQTWNEGDLQLNRKKATAGFDIVKLVGLTVVSYDPVTKTVTVTGGSGSSAWADITGKPTTLSGFGITDGITAAAVAAGYQPLATVLTNTTASFTTAQETKLSGIAAGAEVNVNADWNAVSGDAQILNKPTLGTMAAETASNYLTTASAASTYQPLDSDLTSIAALTTTTHGRALLTDADAAASRTRLGLGTLATQNGTISDYLTTASAASSYQPLDSDLTAWAAINPTTWTGSTSLTTLGTITTGTWQGSIIGPSYLGTGSSISTKFLRGDGTWQTVSGSGSIGGSTGGADNAILVADGAGGSTLKASGAIVNSSGHVISESIFQVTPASPNSWNSTLGAQDLKFQLDDGLGVISQVHFDAVPLSASGLLEMTNPDATGTREILLDGVARFLQLADTPSSYTGHGGKLVAVNGAENALEFITPSGGVTDGDKGDIVVSGTGATWTIDTDVVTFAKMQEISSVHLIGRHAGGTGNPQEVSVGNGLEFSGSGIRRSALTGDVTAPAGSNSTTIANGAVTASKLATTLDLSAFTLTLPSDVTRLGSSIDLASEVTGTLPIANGGTGATTQTNAFDALAPTTTKGDLIVHNGTDNVRLAGGTDGHVLTRDSTTAEGVKWAAGGGGGSGAMVLLASATASSSADVTFDNVFDSAIYAEYELRFQGVQPVTDNVAFRIQLRNSSPADITDTYRIGRLGQRIDSTASANQSNLNATTGVIIGGNLGNSTNELTTGFLIISPTEGQWTHISGMWYLTGTTTDRYHITASGACEGTTAPAGVKIYMSSGNISIGTFQLYGIKK